MKLKHHPVNQKQFATLFVEPKPEIDDKGYALKYATVDEAIKALPKRHGGVIIVDGEFKLNKAIRFPKGVPVTLIGGVYKISRKANAFVEIPEGYGKNNVITRTCVEFPKRGRAATVQIGAGKK
jgi:hypothetical protein